MTINMCHCMTDEEYEMWVARLKEAQKKAAESVKKEMPITVRA